MNRKVVIGALVLLGAAIGLFLKVRAGDEAPADHAGAQGSGSVVASDPEHARVPAPSLAGTAAVAPSGGSGNPREYVIDDIRVRDHRSGDQKPLDIPPNIHPPESRELPSTLTHAITQKVNAALQQCGASVPRESRGPSPRLEGQIVVAIKDHQLAVTKSTMQLRDVDGSIVESVKQCIEQKSLGLQTEAADEADLDSYSINLKFVLL